MNTIKNTRSWCKASSIFSTSTTTASILVSVVVIVVVVVVVVFGLLSFSPFLCRCDRRKLHDHFKSLWNRTTGIFHASNGGLDLFLLRHFSKVDAGWIVVLGVVSFLLGIPFLSQRRIRRQSPVGGLLFRPFLGCGGLPGLAVDLLFDLHRGGFCVPVAAGKPSSRTARRRSLGTSRRDGTIGDGVLLVPDCVSDASFVTVDVLGVAPRRGLGLFLSSVGDDVVKRFSDPTGVGASH